MLKIVASDKLAKNALRPGLCWELTVSWICLGLTLASREGRERKRKQEHQLCRNL